MKKLKHLKYEGNKIVIPCREVMRNPRVFSLIDADLERAELKDFDLFRAKMIGAKINWARFTGSNLRKADFSTARIYHSTFTRADLRGATFTAATIEDNVFDYCDLRDTGLTEEKLKEGGNSVEWAAFNDEQYEALVTEKARINKEIEEKKKERKEENRKFEEDRAKRRAERDERERIERAVAESMAGRGGFSRLAYPSASESFSEWMRALTREGGTTWEPVDVSGGVVRPTANQEHLIRYIRESRPRVEYEALAPAVEEISWLS